MPLLLDTEPIRRCDIFTSPSSSPSSPSTTSAPGENPATPLLTHEYITPHPQPTSEEDSTTHAFRLFRHTEDTTITLADDDASSASHPPRRPLSYYLAQPVSPQQKAQYRAAAVSGEDVVRFAEVPCPGLRMQWRVARVRDSSKASHRAGGEVDREGNKSKRRRKGKRTRIRIRMSLREQVEERAKRKVGGANIGRKLQGKEEHVKEKRRRLNKKKQVRRRERERERKKTGRPGQDLGSGASRVDDDV